jgi:hypothetical protein
MLCQCRLAGVLTLIKTHDVVDRPKLGESGDPLIGFLDFFDRAVADADMHRLDPFEQREEVLGHGCIVATTLHLRNELPLTAKIVLAFRNVVFRFL